MEVISPLTVSIERLHTSFKASQVDLFQRYTSEDFIITDLSCSHHIDAIHVMDNNIIKLWQIDTDMICSFNPLLTVHSLSFGQSSMDVGHQCDMQSHSDSHTNLHFFGNMDFYTSPPPPPFHPLLHPLVATHGAMKHKRYPFTNLFQALWWLLHTRCI